MIPGRRLMREIIKAPLWLRYTSPCSEVLVRGKSNILCSGTKVVSYFPGRENIPKQLPPFTIGGLPPRSRQSDSSFFISCSSPLVPFFSPSPPAIMITERALFSAITACMIEKERSAETAKTNRSTGLGRSVTVGIQAQPSSLSEPGLITYTFSWGNPCARILFRIICPIFIFLDTPIIPILPGSKR